MTLFGIKNCDTVRKAQKFIEANKLAVDFHDFRQDGLTREQLEHWASLTDWTLLFNKRSTSFRALSEDDKNDINQEKAIDLMLANPTLIKRPVLVEQDKLMLGFKEADYKAWFNL
ncbi:arsenate reductase [Shewanella surugensis]|uniref:Arsenate reductase n=1 Tax=Shewanella surugensis TaxID=212020 RepID=A0ABT0LCP2_9GAMM|nr:arsenate reductase [Shewanella surugensis]MCL1125479.1 arsenate reductase [Shewanella surugensis]